MLQQLQETEVPAAQVRVTPQEFAQATAALESRKDTQAQHEATTIPIGEAVQQLGLETTPEELLAEVRAQRSQTKQTVSAQGNRSRALPTLRVVVAAQSAALLACGMYFLSAQRMVSSVAAPIATPASAVMTVAPPKPVDVTIPQQLNPDFHRLVIPEGQTATCKFATIEALLQGNKPSDIWVANKPQGTSWTLLNKNGSLFVQGWTTTAQAEQLLNKHNGLIYNSRNDGMGDRPDVPITVPIEMFRSTAIHASNADGEPVGVVVGQ